LLSRVSSVHNSLGGTVTRNYSYVYDNASRVTSTNNASRVTSTNEPRGAIASGYTDRNEVNSITEPSGSPFADQAFAYDAGFNRSSWTLGSATTTYAVNNLNQYSTVSGTTAPTWNTDGGLATYAGNTYVYDALQRLTEIDYAGGKRGLARGHTAFHSWGIGLHGLPRERTVEAQPFRVVRSVIQ
jgi:hypothetical protein